MFKPALIGLAILAFTTTAILAQDKIDCGSAYKNSLNRLRHKQLSPQRLATLSRWALRIYDACQTEDLANAKTLFDSLDRLKD
jgi:hypothetical protein